MPTGSGAGLARPCQLPAQLAPEAVAVETQTDVLLNSHMMGGFPAACPSRAMSQRAGQAGRVETDSLWEGAPQALSLPWPRLSEAIQRRRDLG